MKIILSNIFKNEIIPDENFPDYGTRKVTPAIKIINKHKVITGRIYVGRPPFCLFNQPHNSLILVVDTY